MFALTIIGMVGMVIPAIMVYIAAGLSRYYPGTIWVGPAAVIIPIAMFVCILLVIMEDLRMKQMQDQLVRQGYLRRGGDL